MISRILKWLDYGRQSDPAPASRPHTAREAAEAEWTAVQKRNCMAFWEDYYEREKQLSVLEYNSRMGVFRRDLGLDEFVLGGQFPDVESMSWKDYEENIIPLVNAEIERRWGNDETPGEGGDRG